MRLDQNRTVYFLLLFMLFAWSGCPAPAEAERAIKVSDPTPAPPGQERVIVAFGDSLTAGLRVGPEETYPAVLWRKIKDAGYSYRVVNSGVSGETTAGGLRRVRQILEDRPEIVILELGANDGLRGLAIDQTEKNLAGIIEYLQKENIRVVLAGMKLPPNYGREYTDAFQNIFPKLAVRYRLTLIPFFLEGVATRSDLNQADGIHPTAEGYQIIVDHLWPKIEPLLKK